IAALSDPGDDEVLRKKLLFRGFASKIGDLRRQVKSRFSEHYQTQLLPLIAQADELRKSRNENLHAVWQVMVDANTGEFKEIRRFRHSPSKNGLQLDLATPSVDGLTNLAAKITDCANHLQETINHAYDMDERVHEWRAIHNI